MEKVIKLAQVRRSGVSDYERDVLETFGQGGDAGHDHVDPATILAEARAEAEEKVREAIDEGMRRGIANGEKRFDESVAASAEALHSAADALERSRDLFLDSTQAQVLRLAFAIAGRILRREAEATPAEVVQTTARAALERLLDEECVHLHVNPADLGALRERRIELLEEFDGVKELDLIPDDDVPPGGCIAETDQLHVDARLQTQLQQILDRLDDRNDE